MGLPLLRPMIHGAERGRKKTVRHTASGRRSKKTEEGDKYLLWGRRRNRLTDNFTLAVYTQFLVAADTWRLVCPIVCSTVATAPYRLCPRPVAPPGHSTTATRHLPHVGTVLTLPQRAFSRYGVVGDVSGHAIRDILRAPDAINIHGPAPAAHTYAIGTRISTRMRAGQRHMRGATEHLPDPCGLCLSASRTGCFYLLGNLQIYSHLRDAPNHPLLAVLEFERGVLVLMCRAVHQVARPDFAPVAEALSKSLCRHG
jgi:hypothetical protein